MRRFILQTLGCKANLYDTQMIEGQLRKKGWSAANPGDPADLIVVNSCTVTNEADRQSRKLAARLKRKHPGAKVVFTGCGAEVEPESLRKESALDFIVGNQDKPQLVDWVLDKDHLQSESPQVLGSVSDYQEMRSRHPEDREWPLPEKVFFRPDELKGDGDSSSSSARTRMFLKIQEGCNSFCTYCVIPYGRGPSRSLRPIEVIEQVKSLVDAGVQEVIITGTNIGDYGADWSQAPRGEALAETLRLVLKETDLPRLRVSSLDPTEITDSLIELMKENSRFLPHFHVSLQSPHSQTLKRMKRRYGYEEVEQTLLKIAALPRHVFVGMDLIAGFPGETEEDHRWGMDALSQLPWSRLHVFPYSERQGTPATRLRDSVPMRDRKRRTKEWMALSLQRQELHARQWVEKSKGVLEGVLLERPCRGPDGTKRWIGGYTPNYIRVLTPLPETGDLSALENQITSLQVHAEGQAVVLDRAAGDLVVLAQSTSKTQESDHPLS